MDGYCVEPDHISLIEAAKLSLLAISGLMFQSWPADLGDLPTAAETKENLSNSPPIIFRGGHAIVDETQGIDVLASLFLAINQFHTNGISPDNIFSYSKAGRLILHTNRNVSPICRTSTLFIEISKRYETVLLPLQSGNISYQQLYLAGVEHVGYYENTVQGTGFYWQWIPRFDSDGLVSGGRLELVGNMSAMFRRHIPKKLVVQK
jgi:hypothetical protein